MEPRLLGPRCARRPPISLAPPAPSESRSSPVFGAGSSTWKGKTRSVFDVAGTMVDHSTAKPFCGAVRAVVAHDHCRPPLVGLLSLALGRGQRVESRPVAVNSVRHRRWTPKRLLRLATTPPEGVLVRPAEFGCSKQPNSLVHYQPKSEAEALGIGIGIQEIDVLVGKTNAHLHTLYTLSAMVGATDSCRAGSPLPMVSRSAGQLRARSLISCSATQLGTTDKRDEEKLHWSPDPSCPRTRSQ